MGGPRGPVDNEEFYKLLGKSPPDMKGAWV
jgi:hypothetical protein